MEVTNTLHYRLQCRSPHESKSRVSEKDTINVLQIVQVNNEPSNAHQERVFRRTIMGINNRTSGYNQPEHSTKR